MAPNTVAKGYQNGAGKGRAHDQYLLGCCYALPGVTEGLKPDAGLAVEWLGKAGPAPLLRSPSNRPRRLRPCPPPPSSPPPPSHPHLPPNATFVSFVLETFAEVELDSTST